MGADKSGFSPMSRRTTLASLFGKKVSRDAKPHINPDLQAAGKKHGFKIGKRKGQAD